MPENTRFLQPKRALVVKESTSASIFKSFTKGRFSPVFLLIVLVLAISFLTRVALLFKTGKNFEWSFKNVGGSFAIGAFFDLAMSTYLIVPFVFQLWLTSDKLYRPLWKWVAVVAYIIIIGILLLTNIVPADFNADLK
ncbi:MAG: hypothetical protein M3040_04755, partial [Bacteroidota bacterium]|nr:hypothetical protein [Bacteroidota bacterium]